MKNSLRARPAAAYAVALACLLLLAGCSSDANNTPANTAATPAASATPAQTLSVVEPTQKIKDQKAARGAEEQAAPVLKIVEPREGAEVNGSTVRLRLDLAGDLKGYKPHKDPATGMGNHIHVILDNQPYEAYYELGQPFELRNVSEGPHTIRVFASRPWHESYKNDGSFQMVSFTVKGGGDPTRPTTTATGQQMSNANATNTHANANAAATPAGSPAPEGKDMQPSKAEGVDRTKPLLTYSRPKGEYKGEDADPIMIDFWLTNAKLEGDGGEYRVRYSVDGGPAQHLTKWEPIWLKGWTAGKHSVKVELVDRNDDVVRNGDYNSTTREITVVK